MRRPPPASTGTGRCSASAGHVTPSPSRAASFCRAPPPSRRRSTCRPRERARHRGGWSAVAWAALPRRAVGWRAAEPLVSGARVLGGRRPAVQPCPWSVACPRAASAAGEDAPDASGGLALPPSAAGGPAQPRHRGCSGVACGARDHPRRPPHASVDAVPALQGARSPRRPPGCSVDASPLVGVVVFPTTPPWTPDSRRLGGSP
jgi:hypothetical protein